MCSGVSIGYFLFVESANSTSPYSRSPSLGLTSSRRSIFGDIGASILQTSGSRQLRSSQLRLNGLAHSVKVVPLGNLSAVNEDRRRAVDSLGLGFGDGGLNTRSLLAAVETLIECSGIQSQGLSHLLETSVGKTVRTALIEEQGVVVPPIGALIGRTGGGFGGTHRFRTTKSVVTIFESNDAGLDVLGKELGFHRTGELSAAWSGVVSPLHHGHWGILRSHDHARDRNLVRHRLGGEDRRTGFARSGNEEHNESNEERRADRAPENRQS